jgi:hypothetical protein
VSNHNDDPSRCQTGDEFLRWCTRHGGSIENGGRHPKVRFGSQMRPVPHGTLAKGTKHALLKWLIVVGVAIWIITLIF